MALSVDHGTFTRQTGTGNQVVSHGGSFTGKVVFFWANEQTTTGFEINYTHAFGVAASATKQRSIAFGSTDDANNSGRAHVADAAISVLQNGDATLSGQADFVSFASGQFTIDWTTNDGTQSIVHYMVLGGTDISDVDVDHYVSNTSTGNQTVSGLDLNGSTPSFGVWFGCNSVTAIDTSDIKTSASIGMASGATERGASVMRLHHENSMGTRSARWQVTDRIQAQFGAQLSVVDAEIDLVSFGADQFVVDVVDAPGDAYIVCYAVIAGDIQAFVGNDTQKTSTGTEATTGVGFQPDGLMFLSTNQTAAAGREPNMHMTIGGGDGTTESCVWAADDDDVLTEDARDNHSTTKALLFATPTAGSATLDAEADIDSFDSDGFTLDWTTADSVAREFLFAAFAGAAAEGPATRSVTDGLFMDSLDARGHLKYFLDEMLLADVALAQRVRSRLAADGLFLLDRRLSTRDLAVLDALLTADVAIKAWQKVVEETLLLGDTVDAQVSGLVIIERTVTDTLLLLDRAFRDITAVRGDSLLLGDDVLDQAIRAALATDGLLLADLRLQDRALVERESLLLSDLLRKTLDKLIAEQMLLADAILVEAGKRVRAIDGLLFADVRISALDKTISDNLLLADFALKDLARRERDGLLLGDTVDAQFLRSAIRRAVTDGLLMLDRTIKARESVVADRLLLGDARYSEILKTLLDALLLADTVDTTIGAAAIERAVTDTLAMFDRATKARAHVAGDSLLLGDARFSALLKILLDSVLLTDSVDASIIEAAAEALVFAVLRAVDILGIKTGSQPDFLGIRTGAIVQRGGLQ